MAYPNARSRGNYLLEPSIKDIETWLDWKARQLDMPCWWGELTAIPGVEDPRKLDWKIQASFLIPAVRNQVFLGQGYTTAPAPKCLTWNVFLLDELSYQDAQQQPFLLTVAYAWGLQYWAERLNPLVDPDFCPLARSVLELRERVKEHIICTKQDVIQGLGRIDPGTTSQLPQPTPTDLGRVDSPLSPCVTTVPSTRLQADDRPIGQDASLMEAATQTASTTMSWGKLTSPITPLEQREVENWYVLVMTASIRQLNLETTGVIFGKWWLPHAEVLSRTPVWWPSFQDQFQQEGWSVTKAPL